ncbi:hypothetical protein RAA17_18190 [Komagataeibacter rhaeticus]|nr:hypothetical protein [Komagataeibacter rhaeticus]
MRTRCASTCQPCARSFVHGRLFRRHAGGMRPAATQGAVGRKGGRPSMSTIRVLHQDTALSCKRVS